MGKKDFWVSKSKKIEELYKFSAIEIPSDIPAYELALHLLNPKNKIILDFGCFNGSSSKIILNLGAKKVIGSDIIKEHIEEARRRYKDSRNLLFMENKDLNSPKFYNSFEGVSLIFVHPTIKSERELTKILRLISKLTKEGSNLVILGIHPNSFKKDYKFLFYEHELPPLKSYRDGLAFRNKIKLPDSSNSLEFFDYCWTENTLKKLLEKEHFHIEKIISVGFNLAPPLNKIFLNSLKKVNKQFPEINWLDEWSAPLYQIILAKK